MITAILLSSAFSFLAGALGGVLLYRNNVEKARNLEAKAKTIADEFKK
jgi:hypothetical protein